MLHLFLKALATSMSDMNDFSASQAAWKRFTERMDAQNGPEPNLYVVATPIGNLGDLSWRACETLARCDVIAAEDTRASRGLLDAWGIATPLMAAHRHNEASAAQSIVERLARCERVALVSDAGAPAVSDPGARIVRAVREAGYVVRSEEHTSELQSLMRISYAVFCLKKKTKQKPEQQTT